MPAPKTEETTTIPEGKLAMSLVNQTILRRVGAAGLARYKIHSAAVTICKLSVAHSRCPFNVAQKCSGAGGNSTGSPLPSSFFVLPF